MKGTMVLFIAIVVGALAAVLAKTQINKSITEKTQHWEPEEVCVAKHTLRPGDVIDVNQDIAIKKVPKELALIKGYVAASARDQLEEQMVRVEITEGKIIDRYYLGRMDNPEENSARNLKPAEDSRLIPIRVDEISGIAGYLQPRDRVDVLHTNREKMTQVVMQNVMIKYVGVAGSGRGSRRQSYNSITVQVSPREAMILTNAMATGDIMLTKRSSTDAEVLPSSKLPPVKPDLEYQKLQTR